MKPRALIKEQAKATFIAQYGVSLGALLLVMVISWAVSGVVGFINAQRVILSILSGYGAALPFAPGAGFLSFLASLAGVFVMLPLTVGYNNFTLRIYRGEPGDIGGMFRTGFANYWRHVGGMLWMALFTFLWTLLFIVPGIIKAMAYFMTPYILSDCPNVTATDALKLSMRMTAGHKGKVFVMGLSFIGWGILTALTGGILGIFYTGPYSCTSFAGLYHELKYEALNKGVVSPAELGMAA
jgi:uncharacterized membrane protein